MILDDPDARQAVRIRPRCEWCRTQFLFVPAECCHIHAKGSGQVDHPANLIGLCRLCHQSQHDGNEPSVDQLLAKAAARERVTPEDITELVHLVRRHGIGGRSALTDERTWAMGQLREILERRATCETLNT